MKGQQIVTWNDPGEWIWDEEKQLHYCNVPLVADENGNGVRVIIFKYEPGSVVRPHYHETDYVSIVVEGSMEITRRQHGVGTVRHVKAGTVYGPLETGPDGCTVIDVFVTGTPDPKLTPNMIYASDAKAAATE